MKIDNQFIVFEDEQFGIILQCFDLAIADSFDDFVAENFTHEVFFEFTNKSVKFFFGFHASLDEVRELYYNFINL